MLIYLCSCFIMCVDVLRKGLSVSQFLTNNQGIAELLLEDGSRSRKHAQHKLHGNVPVNMGDDFAPALDEFADFGKTATHIRADVDDIHDTKTSALQQARIIIQVNDRTTL